MRLTRIIYPTVASGLWLAGAYLHLRSDADAITRHQRASSVGPPTSRRVSAADRAYHAFAVITTRQILLTNLRLPFAPDTVTLDAEVSAYLWTCVHVRSPWT